MARPAPTGRSRRRSRGMGRREAVFTGRCPRAPHAAACYIHAPIWRCQSPQATQGPAALRATNARRAAGAGSAGRKPGRHSLARRRPRRRPVVVWALRVAQTGCPGGAALCLELPGFRLGVAQLGAHGLELALHLELALQRVTSMAEPCARKPAARARAYRHVGRPRRTYARAHARGVPVEAASVLRDAGRPLGERSRTEPVTADLIHRAPTVAAILSLACPGRMPGRAGPGRAGPACLPTGRVEGERHLAALRLQLRLALAQLRVQQRLRASCAARHVSVVATLASRAPVSPRGSPGSARAWGAANCNK
jgi:hypothetical protein